MDSSSIEESDSDSDEKLSTLTLSVGKNTPSSKSTPGLTLRKHPREKKNSQRVVQRWRVRRYYNEIRCKKKVCCNVKGCVFDTTAFASSLATVFTRPAVSLSIRSIDEDNTENDILHKFDYSFYAREFNCAFQCAGFR